MSETKIPKILHWNWFGPNEVPDYVKNYVETWRKACPDYEINKWDDSNFDVEAYPYTKEAYEAKQYAFISDYARFKFCGEYGGIYLDPDMELLKPLDMFLDNDAFMSFKQYWHIFGLTGGVFGCSKGSEFAKEVMKIWDERGFVQNQDGLYVTVSHVMIEAAKNRGIVMENKFQKGDGITAYPCEYLCPRVPYPEHEDDETTFEITENTHGIHHFCSSWLTDEIRDKFWKAEFRKQKEDPSRAERYKKEIENSKDGGKVE